MFLFLNFPVCLKPFKPKSNKERLLSPVVLSDVTVVMPEKESHCRRGSIELVDLQPLHSLPVPAGVRVVRGALEEKRGATVHQRRVDDV